MSPDHRTHRGPHPDDRRLFAPECWPVLRAAVDDLCWLLSRGYPAESSRKLVGDRYELPVRQRTAMERCACSDAARMSRASRQVTAEALVGQHLWIDGYNALTTVEAALAGGVILCGRDGCYRDMASMHGSYRKVSETRPALELLGETLCALGVAQTHWLFDRPVSNSGRLKQFIETLAAERGLTWRVELVANPDADLSVCPAIIATADSAVLDRCARWFNLAAATILRGVPDAFIPRW